MRSVPLLVFKAAFLGTLSVVIVGCGGTTFTSGNGTTAVTAPAIASNSAPAGSTNSSASNPGSSGSTAPPPSSSSPTSNPAPSPAPGQTGTTISGIEQMSGWDSCDTCAGGGTIAYSMTPGLSYPQPGTTQFSVGQGTPWANALWWKRLGNDPNPSHFVLTLDEYIENPSASFGIEYEANQLVDGQWYDFATQCSFGYGIWQLWDPANQKWVPTSVPCLRPAPSTHTQIRLEFQRSNGHVLFVSIGTNGNIVPVNMAFNPQLLNGLSGDFGVHIQLNANANPDPYSVWVHDMALNYW